MIHESWKPFWDQLEKNIDVDLEVLYSGKEIVYPRKEDVFRVLEMDVREITVVLLGQDPYHHPGQAHGLSFSVPSGVAIPPSLRNIYKELKNEFPEREYTFDSGNLESWFYREKICLLNASLTVIQHTPGSHMNVWKEFTNQLIQFISEQNNTCVFLLLGKVAKEKETYIQHKERIIRGVHPSPLSASRGFLGSNIFKQTETCLQKPINWSIS
jgi:uracil-DNA glycosylase